MSHFLLKFMSDGQTFRIANSNILFAYIKHTFVYNKIINTNFHIEAKLPPQAVFQFVKFTIV